MADSMLQHNGLGNFSHPPVHYVINNDTPIDATSKKRRHESPPSLERSLPLTFLANTCQQEHLERSSLTCSKSRTPPLGNRTLTSSLLCATSPHHTFKTLSWAAVKLIWPNLLGPASARDLALFPLSALKSLKRLHITGLADPTCWSSAFVDLAR